MHAIWPRLVRGFFSLHIVKFIFLQPREQPGEQVFPGHCHPHQPDLVDAVGFVSRWPLRSDDLDNEHQTDHGRQDQDANKTGQEHSHRKTATAIRPPPIMAL